MLENNLQQAATELYTRGKNRCSAVAYGSGMLVAEPMRPTANECLIALQEQRYGIYGKRRAAR